MIALAAWTGFALWAVVLLACEAMDALYCGMETGLYVMNKVRLDLRAEAGRPDAVFLQRLVRNYGKLLAVLLLGTNISRYFGTFAISAMFVLAGQGEHAEWWTLAVATPVLFVMGDAVPKGVFQRLPERVVYRLAGLLRISRVAFTVTGLAPLVSAVSTGLLRLVGSAGRASESLGRHPEIQIAIAEGQASGLLTHFQSVMADRVMNIADVTVADVMHPRSQWFAAPASISREGLLEMIRHRDHSRLPLLDTADQVVGILDIYDILAGSEDAQPAAAARPPLVLPAEMPVTEALYQMQRSGQHMAVVRNTRGRHVGILTIKDLVEEIVGELEAW